MQTSKRIRCGGGTVASLQHHAPTNSPLTYSCGIVGHALYSLMASRSPGLYTWVVGASSTRTELRYQLAGSNKMVDSHLQAVAGRRPASIAEQLASEAHHFKQCHPAHAPRPAHSPPRTRPDACVRVSRLVGCTAISDSSTGTGGKHEAAIALRQGLWQVLLTGQRLSAVSSSRILMAQEQMQPVHSAKG
jgi:hypothetical protein